MYIPKNRIQTNLYTQGEEYKKISTGEPYTGYYWTMYNGTIFTGVTPNDKPTDQLIPIENEEEVVKLEEEGKSYQQYANNYDSEVVPGQYQNMNDIDTYNQINKVDISTTKLVPQQYYPTPTSEEYKLGSFTRYFACKINEIEYVELDKLTFTKMKLRNKQYLYELYKLFVVEWTLIGQENEVFNANQNVVILTEESIGKAGLRNFLRNDYLKFYAPNSGEILKSNGEDGLVLPDGTAYIGEYHVMVDGTPMTGRTHGKGQNITLTRIYD
jgi:hypothetical protein|tara:strand:- start:33 stop:842 length:810 start_codon:yes stop_codon:yes gene_type:complete